MSGSKLSDVSTPPIAEAKAAHRRDEPLGMTVHSMSVPSAEPGSEGRRTRLGRWKMALVMLVCAAPVIASYFTYYVIRPDGRTVFGQLIDPQRPLPDLPMQYLDGQQGNVRALKGQWLLVTVADGACDATCERNLYLQRQLRESVGREKERIDRVWLISDAAPVDQKLLPALKGAEVARVDAQALAQWLAPADGHALADHLYLVDPLGNWMLRFPARMDMASAAKAKRDLDRVLRASSSWDKEGR
jgi:hypothetical protein